MKIAILGGGFTGLTASYYAQSAGHEVVLYEKEPVLGGLAVGFRQPNWEWSLERAYHHLFKNDHDILELAKETGFDGINFSAPQTSSLFEAPDGGLTAVPFDTPQDLLSFPYLSFPDKIRTGAVLAALKISPPLGFYERLTSEEFLRKTMGSTVWDTLWAELFRKKFGKYAGNILASFIWARVTKRTKELGYPEGGFQTLVEHISGVLAKRRISLNAGWTVTGISHARGVFKIDAVNKEGKAISDRFEAVICTLPSPIAVRVTESILPTSYTIGLSKLKFLHAITLILETEKPVLDKIYWLNINATELPFMVAIQHTNFVDKNHYGGNHLAYLARYVEREDPVLKMDTEGLARHWWGGLERINKQIKPKDVISAHQFKGPFAQPIFDRDFLRHKPDFKTPVKGFYMANLDMTYPYDRGTNYAVKLGREVVRYL